MINPLGLYLWEKVDVLEGQFAFAVANNKKEAIDLIIAKYRNMYYMFDDEISIEQVVSTLSNELTSSPPEYFDLDGKEAFISET